MPSFDHLQISLVSFLKAVIGGQCSILVSSNCAEYPFSGLESLEKLSQMILGVAFQGQA